jgi:hypothetical protein
MALTAANVAKVYELLGIPQGGTGLIVTSLSHVPPSLAQAWTSTYTEGDFSAIVTKITAALAAISAEQQTLVEAWLAQWDSIKTATSLTLEGEVGMNFAEEAEKCRESVGNLVGVAVPFGGFLQETWAVYGRGRESSGAGDR